MAETRPKPMALVILDGWGIRRETASNAIHQARTPHMDRWLAERPHAQVETCALHVGLPEGQMGNSEVGHMNLGAGRIVYQDYTRVELAVKEGSLARNPALLKVLDQAKAAGGAVHVLGLLSPGGVHSHQDHLLAAVAVAQKAGVNRVFVHAFLDGRDTPPRSALEYLERFEDSLARLGAEPIASIAGRYWAMDRDKRWDRVAKAWDMLTLGEGQRAASSIQGVTAAYQRGEDDEFIQPTVMVTGKHPRALVQDGDAILMMNFRADRVRELSHAFTDPETGEGAFTGFRRQKLPRLSGYLCLTAYDASLRGVEVAFPPQPLSNLLGELVSARGLRQLRAAETEKYAHVTYFFNGGREEPFPGEERLLVPSPKVATYDAQPEMSARALTDGLIARIREGVFDLIVVNYANPDMVGHTGRIEAAIKAIETVDACLGELAEAILAQGGELLITADHGNAEQMSEEETGQPHTAHTLNPTPLIHVGKRSLTLENGRLCDVAPTLLRLMDLPQPPEMTGRCLVSGL
ncbi:MAG: 2,3-bisphosphoglycerate-independent phosphoglycerate mutase [Magnetococcales bacterium]|nr:2,3-bisphosphoglycerate-independent phosphoglycerate mutase [Magnetococcales bacterium]